MPIIYTKSTDQYELILFRIEESADYFLKHLDFTNEDKVEYDLIKHPLRKIQWLASRFCLKKISKENRTLYIRKSELGKPKFSNHEGYFSISHSDDMIAIIYSKIMDVAIDIEKVQDRIHKIKHKFIHPLDINSDEMLLLTLIWSAKETIYKYYDTRALYSFKSSIAISDKKEDRLIGLVFMDNTPHEFLLNYLILDDFVITWGSKN